VEQVYQLHLKIERAKKHTLELEDAFEGFLNTKPFALAEAGHDVQIFLFAEATSLMRMSMASAILPVGWPPAE
jgi:hypothetical protein